MPVVHGRPERGRAGRHAGDDAVALGRRVPRAGRHGGHAAPPEPERRAGRADRHRPRRRGRDDRRTTRYNHLEYYRYLNCGYRLPLVGGTDKMSSDVPVGLYRTYAHIPTDEEFSYESWCRACAPGGTFLSGGPLLEFTVDGAHDRRHAARCRPAAARWRSRRRRESIFPIHTLEIVQRRAGSSPRPRSSRARGELTLKAHACKVDGHTWLAARCGGPGLRARSRTTTAGSAASSPTPRRSTSPAAASGSCFDPATAQYMLTLIDGSLAYIRNAAAARPPGTRHPPPRRGRSPGLPGAPVPRGARRAQCAAGSRSLTRRASRAGCPRVLPRALRRASASAATTFVLRTWPVRLLGGQDVPHVRVLVGWFTLPAGHRHHDHVHDAPVRPRAQIASPVSSRPSRSATASGSVSPGSACPPTCSHACCRACQRSSTRWLGTCTINADPVTCNGVERGQGSPLRTSSLSRSTSRASSASAAAIVIQRVHQSARPAYRVLTTSLFAPYRLRPCRWTGPFPPPIARGGSSGGWSRRPAQPRRCARSDRAAPCPGWSRAIDSAGRDSGPVQDRVG